MKMRWIGIIIHTHENNIFWTKTLRQTVEREWMEVGLWRVWILFSLRFTKHCGIKFYFIIFELALFSFLYFLSKTFLKLFDNFSIFIYRSGGGGKKETFSFMPKPEDKGLNIRALHIRGQSPEDPNIWSLERLEGQQGPVMGTLCLPELYCPVTEDIWGVSGNTISSFVLEVSVSDLNSNPSHNIY